MRIYILYTFLRSFLFVKLDIDECASSDTNECDLNALCTNIEGSYVCRCLNGFTGDGRNCSGECMSV